MKIWAGGKTASEVPPVCSSPSLAAKSVRWLDFSQFRLTTSELRATPLMAARLPHPLKSPDAASEAAPTGAGQADFSYRRQHAARDRGRVTGLDSCALAPTWSPPRPRSLSRQRQARHPLSSAHVRLRVAV
jgi:hypothetical protein